MRTMHKGCWKVERISMYRVTKYDQTIHKVSRLTCQDSFATTEGLDWLLLICWWLIMWQH